MITALLAKELGEHRLALVLTAAIGAFALAVLHAEGRVAEAPSAFSALRWFLILFVLPSAFVAANRLVVHEWQSRAHRFLATLPLPRPIPVALKFTLGLVLVELGVAVAWATCLPADRDLAATTAIRALAAGFFAWGAAFGLAFLGRYRFAAYVGTGVAGVLADAWLGWQWERFAPVAVVDETFATARALPDPRAVAVTVALGAALAALGFAAALLRDGDLATKLAERLSLRGHLTVAGAIIGLAVGFVAVAEQRRAEPYDVPGAMEVSREGVVVKVTVPAGGTEVSRGVARRIAEELSALRDWLGVEERLHVFVATRRDLDPRRFERGAVDPARGIVVRANLSDPAFQADELVAYLVREAVAHLTNGRARKEERAWVLAGLGRYRLTTPGAPLTDTPRLALRALYAAPKGPTAAELDRWYRVEQLHGADVAEGLAWSGLQALSRREGPEAVQAFARAAVGLDAAPGFGALLQDWRSPPRDAIRAAGLAPDALLALWGEELSVAHAALGQELTAIPRLSATWDVEAPSAEARRLAWRVTAFPAPADGARFTVAYAELQGLDTAPEASAVSRDVYTWGTDRTGVLPEVYAPGVRVNATFAMEVEALGGEVLSGWETRVLR